MNLRTCLSERRHRVVNVVRGAVVALTAVFAMLAGCGAKTEKAAPVAAPALSVEVATAAIANWPDTLQVSGAIAAWQEAIIGSEISGQRLLEVCVNVGDRVKKGQVLARFNTDTLMAEQAELTALWRQAEADRQRALALQDKGALSRQQIESYVNQAAVAKARLDAKDLQVRYATVVAPADGVISARNATLGSISTLGGELFRLIVHSRLEWRGELSAEQLSMVKVGQQVTLTLPDGSTASAKIRQLSPSLNSQSRMATAYADIQPGSRAQAGMYVSGTIEMQSQPALVVPAVSVIIRDGRTYVFSVGSAATGSGAPTAGDRPDVIKVSQQLVTTGRQRGAEIEISSGLTTGARVVTQGAGFLNEGDAVRVISVSNSGTKSAQP